MNFTVQLNENESVKQLLKILFFGVNTVYIFTWVFVSGFGLVAEFDAVNKLYAVAIAELVVMLWIDDGLIVDAIFSRVIELAILSNVVVINVASASCCN